MIPIARNMHIDQLDVAFNEYKILIMVKSNKAF